LASLHLKKMPPIPVTFFIFVVLELVCLTMIVLKAKPKQNEVISPKINIDVLFIFQKVLSVKLFDMFTRNR